MEFIQLELYDFKKWNHIKIDFEHNSLIKVNGKSGAGKTTLFEAIYWILYDEIKKTNPRKKVNAKTKGILKLHDIKIERQKMPKKLTVTINDQVYEGESAQNIICERYGDNEIWLCSCYILQDCKNIFLTSTNSTKIDILNKLSFTNDMNVIINKLISEKLLTTEKGLDIYKKDYENEKKLFLSKYESIIQSIENVTNILDNFELKNVEELMEKKSDLLSNLSVEEKNKMNRLMIIENYNQLKKKLQILKEKNIDIPILDEKIKNIFGIDNIDLLKNENFELIISNIKHKNKLLKELDLIDIKNFSIENEKVSKEYLNELKKLYQSSYDKELIYNNNLKTSKLYNIEYDKDIIKNKILELDDIIKSQSYLKELNKMESYKNDIIELNKKKESIVSIEELEKSNPIHKMIEINKIIDEIKSKMEIKEKEIDEINSALSEWKEEKTILMMEEKTIKSQLDILLKNRTEPLLCPNCKIKVKVQNNEIVLYENLDEDIEFSKEKLVKIKLDLENTQNEIINIENILKEYKKIKSDYENEINMINKNYEKEKSEYAIYIQKIKNEQNIVESEIKHKQNMIDTFQFQDFKNKNILPLNEITKLNTMMNNLIKINIVELPEIKSEYYNDLINKINNKMKYNELINNISNINIPSLYNNISIDILEKIVLQIKKYWKEYDQYIKLLEDLNKEKSFYENQINNIIIPIDNENTIENIKSKISILTKEIEEHILMKKIKEEYTKLKEKEDNINQIIEKISMMKDLKKISLETECEILQNTLDSINSNLIDICSSLFTEEIVVELSTVKELKSKKETRNIVHFDIYHNGENCDDIMEMSGGEKGRISLAFTLAINKLTNFPLLILDETLNSLSSEDKEIAFDAIKQNCVGKSILCSIHDDNDEYYDQIIDLNFINNNKNMNIKKVNGKKSARSLIV